MELRTIELKLPDWTLSYLINDDWSGITLDEKLEVDKLLDRLVEEYGSAFAIDAEPLGFTHSNDLDELAGDCSRVTFDVGYL